MTSALAAADFLGGMEGWQRFIFVLGLAIIVTNLLWNVVLHTLSLRSRHGGPEGGDEHDFVWVFVVPALDEEVTIADSVQRLLEVECSNRLIIVVDDGSTDDTPNILAGIDHPDVMVIRRELPDARVGKAAALNHAWRVIGEMSRSGRLVTFDPAHTIVGVVDADGRLASDAPASVASWFAQPDVGGVQVRVRIYNRHHPLTWAQDVEFGVYGMLYQAARARLGTAGMGGNGQFNRLTALDDLAASGTTPWRDRLTEDQDLGLQLIEAGWRCGHDNRTWVDQQGLPGLRRLFRQRTRWAQGNLQAMAHLRTVGRVPRPLGARIDLVLYLMQPVMQAVVGVALATAIISWLIGDAPFLPESLAAIIVFYLFGFGGVILGCIARSGRGPINWVRGWLIAMVYAAYTWLLWPVLIRAAWRQLRSNTGWAKTERESIEGAVNSADRIPS